MADITLDLFEYSTDALAQAAYVSNYAAVNSWYKSLTAEAGVDKHNQRMIVAAASLTTSGTLIRLKLKGYSASAATLTGASIGSRSGSTGNFASAPTRVTFSGSNSGTIPAAGYLYSDWMVFTLDEAADYLVHLAFVTDAANNVGYGSGDGRYYKTNYAVDDTLTEDISALGYSSDSYCVTLTQIDVMGSLGNVSGADSIPTMTSDTAPEGTASTDSTYSASYPAWKAMNDTLGDDASVWISAAGVTAAYLQYQFTSGKVITGYSITGRTDSAALPKSWSLKGSNDGASFDTLDIQTNITDWTVKKKSYTFSNTTSYAYYRLDITASNGSNLAVVEFELFPLIGVMAYSEATIKEEGSYSLKGVSNTSGLNQTLTRTIASPIDLTDKTSATFKIRNSRTGSNIKVGIKDSGGTISEVTPNIASADTYQTGTIDLSGVSDANKDAISQVIVTCVNADAENEFYLDNMVGTGESGGGGTPTYGGLFFANG